eukprot:Hpha_TRINITY_DN13097_c0_g1::TRINITY_DN13097_c0_g1_i1::g.69099::m.69099
MPTFNTPRRRIIDRRDLRVCPYVAVGVWCIVAYTLHVDRPQFLWETPREWSIDNITCGGQQIHPVAASLSSTLSVECTAAVCIDGITTAPPPPCHIQKCLLDANATVGMMATPCCNFTCVSESGLCATDTTQGAAWLRLDLGSSLAVGCVAIHNFFSGGGLWSSWLGYYEIRVGDNPTLPESNRVCSIGSNDTATDAVLVHSGLNCTGRYLFVYLPYDGVPRSLVLHEVSLYAPYNHTSPLDAPYEETPDPAPLDSTDPPMHGVCDGGRLEVTGAMLSSTLPRYGPAPPRRRGKNKNKRNKRKGMPPECKAERCVMNVTHDCNGAFGGCCFNNQTMCHTNTGDPAPWLRVELASPSTLHCVHIERAPINYEWLGLNSNVVQVRVGDNDCGPIYNDVCFEYELTANNDTTMVRHIEPMGCKGKFVYVYHLSSATQLPDEEGHAGWGQHYLHLYSVALYGTPLPTSTPLPGVPTIAPSLSPTTIEACEPLDRFRIIRRSYEEGPDPCDAKGGGEIVTVVQGALLITMGIVVLDPRITPPASIVGRALVRPVMFLTSWVIGLGIRCATRRDDPYCYLFLIVSAYMISFLPLNVLNDFSCLGHSSSPSKNTAYILLICFNSWFMSYVVLHCIRSNWPNTRLGRLCGVGVSYLLKVFVWLPIRGRSTTGVRLRDSIELPGGLTQGLTEGLRQGTWLDEEEHPSKSAGAADCAVCMEPLWRGRAGVLLKTGKRTCPHLLHYRCLAMWVKDHSGCPLCRKPGDEIARLPTPAEDPVKWFTLMDMKEGGGLTQQEVTLGLQAQLDIDEEALAKLVHDEWARWDKSGEGVITVSEVPALLDFIKQTQLPTSKRGSREMSAPPPLPLADVASPLEVSVPRSNPLQPASAEAAELPSTTDDVTLLSQSRSEGGGEGAADGRVTPPRKRVARDVSVTL